MDCTRIWINAINPYMDRPTIQLQIHTFVEDLQIIAVKDSPRFLQNRLRTSLAALAAGNHSTFLNFSQSIPKT